MQYLHTHKSYLQTPYNVQMWVVYITESKMTLQNTNARRHNNIRGKALYNTISLFWHSKKIKVASYDYDTELYILDISGFPAWN